MVIRYKLNRKNKMKKINLSMALSGFLLLSGNVYAESMPLTDQNIQGSWVLDYTKKSEKSQETSAREDTWIFNNGKVTITHIPRNGSYYDQLPVNYEIKDGKLNVAILGRAGRFDKFSVVNKDENNMTLKATYGDIYQFIKK